MLRLIPALLLASACGPAPGILDDTFFVRVDDADLFVRVAGDSTTNRWLLWVGDGGSHETLRSTPAASLLQDEAVVVYMDLTCQGASEGRFSPDDLNAARHADDISAILYVIEPMYLESRQGEPQIWLMPHRIGTLAANELLFNTDFSTRIHGYIEVNGNHDVPRAYADGRTALAAEAAAMLESDLDAEARDEWKALQSEVQALPAHAELAQLRSLEALSARAADLHPEVNDAATGNARWSGSLWTTSNIHAGMDGLLTAERDQSWSESYRTLTLPTLLVSSRYDFAAPASLAEDAARKIASERLQWVSLEHSAHDPWSTEPDAIANTILTFVAEAE